MSSVPSAYEITTIGSDPRDTRRASELHVLATFPISVDLMAGKHSGWNFFHPWEYFILVTRRGQKLVALTQFALYVLKKQIALKKKKTYSTTSRLPIACISRIEVCPQESAVMLVVRNGKSIHLKMSKYQSFLDICFV